MTLRSLSIVLVFTLSLLSATGVTAQNYRVLYGSRAPRICANTKTPTSGPISNVQATQYFICGAEHTFGDNLYLVDKVVVEVGKGRPFLPDTDRIPDGDANYPVYPIRGSYVQYIVDRLSTISPNAGKNCSVFPAPHASGLCYRTTYGNWVCTMIDVMAPSVASQREIAPPQ
jgi:hypothetical protein